MYTYVLYVCTGMCKYANVFTENIHVMYSHEGKTIH